jgi:hypothetical protein
MATGDDDDDDGDGDDDDDDNDGNGATGDGVPRRWRQRWRQTTTMVEIWLVPDLGEWRQVCKNGILKRKVKKK